MWINISTISISTISVSTISISTISISTLSVSTISVSTISISTTSISTMNIHTIILLKYAMSRTTDNQIFSQCFSSVNSIQIFLSDADILSLRWGWLACADKDYVYVITSWYG